ESRFYLSLDDELMRLFATGALSYVMNKALPDDEAIEAKMVTKAIERAQTTVETRNAEIRKNVLKYDEVMNEQRKVIYARRDQILEGLDLKSAAMDYLSEAVHALLETHCASAADDEWDLDGLAKELKTFWPTDITEERLTACRDTDEMYNLVMTDATAYYALREEQLGPKVMREVERQLMLRIIDQRWREHLEEMDYLKEGINLRAMGQKDPLTEWQREGYEMFGMMMKGIAQDFVRYVMHVQVVQNEQPQPAATAAGPAAPAPAAVAPADTLPSGLQNLQTTSSDDEDTSGFRTAAASAVASGEAPPEVLAPAASPTAIPRASARSRQSTRQTARPAAKQETVVKDEWAKTSRNAPCPCGSGKKFKMCHGAG
ncbi:MAG: SEC-C metal-binding domain-containing protein, partial [Ilumatobacteraceae bacterium]